MSAAGGVGLHVPKMVKKIKACCVMKVWQRIPWIAQAGQLHHRGLQVGQLHHSRVWPPLKAAEEEAEAARKAAEVALRAEAEAAQKVSEAAALKAQTDEAAAGCGHLSLNHVVPRG